MLKKSKKTSIIILIKHTIVFKYTINNYFKPLKNRLKLTSLTKPRRLYQLNIHLKFISYPKMSGDAIFSQKLLTLNNSKQS